MTGAEQQLTSGSLFSGYGGLALAVEQALGARTAWVSDVEPAANRILTHRFPGVPNLGDITTIDWVTVPRVDVIEGGSPCQDVSAAGKRAGMRAGTRSGLWAAMCDAIDIIRPRLVVWENVRGALSAGADSAVEPCPICLGDERECTLRALGRVLGDLSELGYDAAWSVVRASEVGAPHGRARVWVLGWLTDPDTAQVGRRPARGDDRVRPAVGGESGSGGAYLAADPGGEACPLGAGLRADGEGRVGWGRPDHGCAPVAAADPVSSRWDRRAPDTVGGAQDRAAAPGAGSGAHGRAASDLAWGDYEPAVRRWEAVTGRPAPAPTELSPRGSQRLSARFVEWLMGLPDGWVCDVPGVSRNDQLKALGNGVVPQQGIAAIRHLLQFVPATLLAEVAS